MPITLAEIQAFIFSGTVANYSALPSAASVPNSYWWAQASEGTKWLPGPMGGTYYPAGTYHSNGTTWEYMETPYQATQADVDAGVITDQFVSPSTFTNASKWTTKENIITPGTTSQYWRGDKTFVDFATDVRGSVLTGLSITGSAILATDTVLQAFGKIQNQLNNVSYPVTSVFGRTGAVGATSGDYNTSQVTEVTNLYFTNARVNTQVATYTGDVTLSGTTFAIGSGKVTNTMLAGGITDAKLNSVYIYADGTRSLTGNWDAGAFLITSQAQKVSGTGGNGYMEFVAQSSNASAPAASGFRLFAGSTGSFNWVRKNGSDTFVRTFDATLTADRTYTLQDVSSTIAMYSNNLSVFASTTSAQLAGVISDETGTGVLVFATTPTFTTNITTPLIIGGTAVGSGITYQSTTGNGTSSGAAHIFTGGNNGGTTIATMLNNGNVGVGISPTARLHVANSTSGAGSGLAIELTVNGTASVSYTGIDFYITGTTLAGQFFATASNYSNSNALNANSIGLFAELTSGQLCLGASGSSGIIDFITGGNATTNRRGRILSTGEWILGNGTAVVASEFLSIQGSANSNFTTRAKNSTSGTAAACSFIASNSGNNAISMTAYSAGFTTSGLSIAGGGALFTGSGLSGGLAVGTVGSNVLGLYTNNVLRITVSGSSGDTDFTGYIKATQSVNGDLAFGSFNANAGAAARAFNQCGNGTITYSMIQNGTGYTTAGLLVANLSYMFTGSAVGTYYFNSNSASKFLWAIGGTGTANEIMRMTTTGVGIMTLADPASYLMLGAGTTSLAPFGFTAGTNRTTALAGTFEYNGTNLFFTRTGTTRENVIIGTKVSGTFLAPDTANAIKVNVNGVDYNLQIVN